MKHIFGFQKRVDDIAPQTKFATPGMVQQVFEQVGRLLQDGKPESTCAALDGVCRAKDRVEILDIRIVDIEIQQQALHIRQQLFGFFKESLVKI